MRKLIITEWLSLDGIFDAGLMHKWWMPFDSDSRQKFIQDTINNSEIMLYGRVTYEMLFPYWSSFTTNEQGVADKLNQNKKYLVTSTLKTAPWENTTIIEKDWIGTVKSIKSDGDGYILVQGSRSLIRPLLEAGLVDEVRLLINPAIVGQGERLFSEGIDADFETVNTQQFEKGVVLLTLRPRLK
nr:dihydrofolate reductase family protein [uncultured Mucilaginibacter sp.]